MSGTQIRLLASFGAAILALIAVLIVVFLLRSTYG
jgi:hypothetical protein